MTAGILYSHGLECQVVHDTCRLVPGTGWHVSCTIGMHHRHAGYPVLPPSTAKDPQPTARFR
ncbi:MAG: hypothetical protein ACKO3W_04625, partial [bacterium]